ncbi:hypothetical protein PQX77_015945 [Marasmius sp. AFHP31]|nr:hypothetical protein PQX77_015945 [Marasmius sp. AFHP31]
MAADILSLSLSYWVISDLGSTTTLLKAGVARGSLEICRLVIILLMSTMADTMLIYRCFVIWNWNRRLFAMIVVACCVTFNGLAAITSIWMTASRTPYHGRFIEPPAVDHHFYILSLLSAASHLFINLVLTIMIAGRILWVAHIASRTQDSDITRFRMIVVIIIESGVLYLAAWVGFLLGMRVGVNVGSMAIQVAAIAPTLIIVRANMTKEKDTGENLSRGSLAAVVTSMEEQVILENVSKESTHPAT